MNNKNSSKSDKPSAKKNIILVLINDMSTKISIWYKAQIKFLREFNIEYLRNNLHMTPLLLPMVLCGFMTASLLGIIPVFMFYSVSSEPNSVTTCFYPPSGCKELVIREINQAQKTMYILVSHFYSKDLRDAVISAKRRGVEVKFVTKRDVWHAPEAKVYFLAHEKVSAKGLVQDVALGSNYIVIDDKKTITGSFNMLKEAEPKVMENIVIIDDKKLAKLHRAKFLEIFKKAVEPQLIWK